MYPFLNGVTEEALRRVVHAALPGIDSGRMDQFDRAQLYSILFSLHGFDLLSEASLRQAMLLSVSETDLQRIAVSAEVDPFGKTFDVALRIANQPWRAGGVTPAVLEGEFKIPGEFLPNKSDRDPSVEIVEPYSDLPSLFDYQEEMVTALTDSLSAESPRACLLQLPTGAGKTRVTMEGISRFLNKRDVEQRDVGVLWMAHSEELCDQAVDAFLRTWTSKGSFNVRLARYWGPYQSTIEELKGSFVVAGYQKLVSLASKRGPDFEKLASSLALVVIDEAHKALAPTVKSLLDYFRRRTIRVVGLTATPGRGQDAELENRRLANLFDRNLLRSSSLGDDPIRALQGRGILARVRRTVVDTGFRIVHGSADSQGEEGLDDMPAQVLGRLARDESRNRLIVDTVRSHVARGFPTLVFCCTVEHARDLAVDAASCGIKSAFLDCRMARGRRRRVIAAFRSGFVEALFNFGVLSTGFDAPNIQCVVIARPTSSIVLYSQMVGRGLRGSAVGGSSEFVLVDVRDNTETFGEIGEVYRHFEDYWAS